MAELEQDPGLPDPLVADMRVLRKRVLATFVGDESLSQKAFAKLIGNEIIPALIMAVERIVEMDEVVEEIADQQGSYLQDEDARQIMETVQIALMIMAEVGKLLPALDDVSQKRLAESIRMFEGSAEMTAMIVSNAALEPDEDEEVTPRQKPVPKPPPPGDPKPDPEEEIDTEDDGEDDEADTVAKGDSDD
jgi:transcriptional regulator NrdR family protein